MKTELLKKLTFAVVLFAATSMSAQLFNFRTGGQQGWAEGFGNAGTGVVSYSATGGEVGTGALQLTRASNNANFGYNTALPVPGTQGIDGSVKKYIKIRYKNETLASQFRVQGNSATGAITNTIFPITPSSTGLVGSGTWTTAYIDMTGVANWTSNINDLDILLRIGYVPAETGSLYIDNIEFIESIPPASMSGIVQNPGFEDLGGSVAPWSPANQSYANVAVSSAEKHAGSYSLKHTYVATPATTDPTHFVFNNYIHTLPASTSDFIVASIWVKVVRAGGVSPTIDIQGQGRTGTTTVVTELSTFSDTKTTTKTDGSWEQVNFSFTPTAPYSTAQFRYGIAVTNLMAGDVIYVDDITATTTANLSTKTSTIEGFGVYPNPATTFVSVTSKNGGLISVYNTLGAEVLADKAVSANYQLNVSGLSSGVYLLKLTSEGKSGITKLVIK
ncbi:T9SS type A sorting domain-containing protein [Flavobacterium sp. 7A]|uniref:T9SS type A sorting domain-containing protein n=1 Tax=Flavobacterium sp. 7A TaxID=2940571 RepID=UPI002227E8CC|nr:T9SS type A sorting domain-containing protein [Flavobacterium sp. 7A]MCW2118194.1 hypothetical protein [Flavobacterium sp. 7A]